MHGGSGNDDSIPRLCGQYRARNLIGVIVEQLDHQILFVSYMVIKGRRADVKLRSESANGQLVPPTLINELPRRRQDLPTGSLWRAARARAWRGGSRHRFIIAPVAM